MIKAEYVSHMGTDLTPVNAARISHGNKSDVLNEKDEKLLSYLATHQHMTPFEHQVLTVIVHCPLYIRSQIHRHRTFSYNEVSRRYSGDDISFYVPPADEIRLQSEINKQGSASQMSSQEANEFCDELGRWLAQGKAMYEFWLRCGVAKETARAFLSVPLMTKFYMTGNLRNWCQFLVLRLDSHAQYEVRLVAQAVEKIIEELWPVSYKALSRRD